MMFFRKSRYFVDVCFAGGARPYTYTSTNDSLRVGQIVHVPMVSGSKLSRVVAIRPCDSDSPNLLRVGRKATDAEALAFHNADACCPKASFPANPVPASLGTSNRVLRHFAFSVQKGI